MPLDEFMNCEEFERLIDQGVGDGVDSVEQQRLLQHLDGCAPCGVVAINHQRYLALMASVQAPALDNTRAVRMIRLAVVKGEQQALIYKRPFTQGFIAASVLVAAVLFGLSSFQNQDKPAALDSLVAQYDWTQDVTIAITVPQDMVGAQLVLQLPADMGIEGYEYLSKVVWPVDLKKGRNTIVLPIMIDELAQFDEQLTVPAALIYNNSQKDFELKLTMDAPQNPSHGLAPAASAFTKLA